MSSDNAELRWEQFEQLVGIVESGKKDIFNSASLTMLQSFVQAEMINYKLPPIQNWELFSEVVLTLRKNYSQWNHRLTYLLIELDSGKAPMLKSDVDDFFDGCPWIMLVDALHNTVEK